jgi:hypothetical protein
MYIKYSSYIHKHTVFSAGSLLLKLIGIKMKTNTSVGMVNQQQFLASGNPQEKL